MLYFPACDFSHDVRVKIKVQIMGWITAIMKVRISVKTWVRIRVWVWIRIRVKFSLKLGSLMPAQVIHYQGIRNQGSLVSCDHPFLVVTPVCFLHVLN